MKEYKYQLAKRIKTVCPQCGRKRFVPYINKETGERLPEKYGRCDREDNCGYHLNPYKDGYGRKSYEQWKAERFERTRNRNYKIPPKTEPKISYIDNTILKQSLSGHERNKLIKYLCQVFAEYENTVMQTLWRYRVGTTKSGETVFWQIDTENRVRAGKIIDYMPDGHRNKSNPGAPPCNWVHSVLRLQDFNLEQCLFGLHLITAETKSVCIVESEKTAIVCSLFKPSVTWIATGGKQNINLIGKAAETLKGRKITLFPDLKAFDDWSAKAKELKERFKLNIRVSDVLERIATPEQREKGFDLADIILNKQSCDANDANDA